MADQVDLIVADLMDFTRGEIIALAVNVNANLRANPPLGTPIDTGWAAANWIMSVGDPYLDPGIDLIKDPTPAQVQARQGLATEGQNSVLAWKNGDGPIFSANNVPYIGALDAGHSMQSPSGFVLAAIEKAIRQTYSRAGSRGSRMRRAAAYRERKPRAKR